MGYRVRLHPGGREFMAEPQETLLEAALRSGVNIHYNCSNGSCGECKARILEGLGEDREFHDYVLSESERKSGVVLLCTTHAASDLVLEARIVGSPAEIPHQQITSKIVKVEHLSGEVIMLLLRTPRTQTLRFMAGQHVELHFTGNMIDLPVASCPCNGMLLQFHLLPGRDEPFATWLTEHVHVGESIRIDGPFGSFLLDEESQHDIVMVGEETGFASLKSLIEHYINLEKPQPLHLYRLAFDEQNIYLNNLCESWRDAIENFFYEPIVFKSTAAYLEQLSNIAEQISNPKQTDVYLAVSEEGAEAAKRVFTHHGVPPHQIFVEHHRSIPRPELFWGSATR